MSEVPQTPAKPATPSQRLDEMELRLAKLEKKIAMVQAVVNALEPNVFGKEARP